MQLLKARALRQYKPFYVALFVTKNCNFRCSYCYGKFYTKEKDLPLDRIQYIIDELAKAGTKRVCLLGGEPLLRDDIGTIVDYLASKNIDVIINTNGSLIEKRINDIRSVSHLYVSFDGRKEAHEANRGAATYEKTVGGIEAALANGFPVGVVSVITKNNINELPYLVDFCSRRNLSLYVYTAMNQVSDNGRLPIGALPTVEEYRKVIKEIINFIDRGAPIRYPKQVYLTSLYWPDYAKDYYLNEPPDFPYIRCFAGKYTCAIDAEGNVFPCVRFCGIEQAGNIFNDGFAQAWKKVNHHSCKACHMESVNEMNLFFAFDKNVISNFIRLTLRKEKKHVRTP